MTPEQDLNEFLAACGHLDDSWPACVLVPGRAVSLGTLRQLAAFLQQADAAKLLLLASWFDADDVRKGRATGSGSQEVQQFLRGLASARASLGGEEAARDA